MFSVRGFVFLVVVMPSEIPELKFYVAFLSLYLKTPQF